MDIKTIILDEKNKAKELLEFGRRLENAKSSIHLVLRYVIQELNHTIGDAENIVTGYATSVYPDMNLNYVKNIISNYIETARQYKLSNIQSISITMDEVQRICELGTVKKQSLAFSLLAIAKYNTIISSEIDYWVRGNRLNEIAKRANLAIPERELCMMLHEMYNAEMIRLSNRVDNCSVQILYNDVENKEESEIDLCDADFCDLGYTWRAYIGEPYIRCNECGRWVRMSSNGRRIYCKDCLVESRRKIHRENYYRKVSI